MPTVGLSEDVYKEFREFCRERNLKMRACADEAIRQWLDKKKKGE